MKIAYIDCFSGISGDMFLAAMIDAGVPSTVFEEAIASLNIGARLAISKVDRSGISATKADVLVNEQVDRPRVEHEHYLPHRHGHTHEHSHEEVMGHTHHITETVVAEAEHEDEHSHAAHEHHHRGLKEIREIIRNSGISVSAKLTATRIFENLGAAEAKIHNVDIEKVHFHEVGAVDAIVDIACAAVAAEALGVDEFVCSPLNVGSGTVKCAHGEFPVPAPATAELLKDAPIFSSGIRAELVTPTGAAIVKTLASRFQPIPGMKIERIGYGAGTRDFSGHANVTRILIGSSGAQPQTGGLTFVEGQRETISVLEANVDDMNPQVFGYLLERALAVGALDVFGTPVQMKKSRPGMLITVLCRPEDSQRLTNLIFSETTTLGVRMREEKRAVLSRRSLSVQTEWGDVRMKVGDLNGAASNYAPEFEDCRRIAEANGVPLKTVMQEATRLYLEKEKNG